MHCDYSFVDILNEINGTDRLKGTLLQFSDDHLSNTNISLFLMVNL
jgi:hypothetical protein